MNPRSRIIGRVVGILPATTGLAVIDIGANPRLAMVAACAAAALWATHIRYSAFAALTLLSAVAGLSVLALWL